METVLERKNGLIREHLVVIVKPADRTLSDDISKKHIETALAGVNTPYYAKRGWSAKAIWASQYSLTKQDYNRDGASVYTYVAKLEIRCDPDKEYPNQDATFDNLLNSLAQKLKFPGKWLVDSIDGKPYEEKKAEDKEKEEAASNEDIGYVPIMMPEDFEEAFDGLFGLDAHISRVKRAINGTIKSGWNQRLHCVLLGDPACGKSDVAHRLRKIFGDESVMEFDATATTMAGAIEELEGRAELPRILIVEEIEKADEKSLAWLLAFMDQRGEIRKRISKKTIQKSTKMICIATANNEEKLKAIASGALYSRFSNKIYFTRPNREVLGMILQREIDKLWKRGETATSDWIEPTLDLGLDVLETTDPRELINLMMCGQDSLLDGSFQREMIATLRPDQAKAIEQRKAEKAAIESEPTKVVSWNKPIV